MTDVYIPFGPEWKKEMMKFTKAELVEYLLLARKKEFSHSILVSFIESMKVLLPYLDDLEKENFTDEGAGIFKDERYTLAYERLRAALNEFDPTLIS